MTKRTKSAPPVGRSKPPAVKSPAAKAAATTASTPKARTPQPAAKSAESSSAASVKPVSGKASRATKSSIVVTDQIRALPDDYRPSEAEPFMNGNQKSYFRRKLQVWREEILRQTRETLDGLTAETSQYADLADRATSETDRSLELRARDRQRKLIAKIDAALARIEDGTYGYCEDTGEPIGLRRLEARPIATLSLEAQERHERRERIHRDD